ncbi:MAG: hypothetical protein FJ095_18275 [Deltaproteobacteria bacterium]|nr:hypothetical protein [Deltaproteobacteria bacterium]
MSEPGPIEPQVTASRRVVTGRAVLTLVAGLVATVVFARLLDRHYPLRDWLALRLLPVWGYTLLFNLACVSAGSQLLARLLGPVEGRALERLVLSMATGLVVFVVALFGFGFVGLMKPTVALGLVLAMTFAGVRSLPALVRAFGEDLGSKAALDGARSSPLVRVLGFLAAGAGAVAVGFMYLEALDPSSMNFDATWYHFPIAQDYARLGRVVPFPGENHRAYPHLTSIVHTWALLVPGVARLPLRWMLALHLEFGIVVWRIVGVAAVMRFMLGGARVRGLWSVFFLFPSIFVYDQSIGGSADHFLGFFAAPIFLALARTLKRFDWRHAVVLGVVLGGHLLTKYQGVYLAFAVFAAVGARLVYFVCLDLRGRGERRGARRWLLGPSVLLATTLAVTAPHTVKNAVFYGNPVYPFAQRVFSSSHPKRGVGYYVETAPEAAFAPKETGLKRQLRVARLLFEHSFDTHNRNLTEHRPYMGSLFSLLLPVLVVARPGRRTWLGAALGIAAFWVWGNTATNDRYMLAFLDLFIATSGVVLVHAWQLGWLARVGLVPVVALQLVWGGDAMLFYGAKRLKPALELVGAGYARRRDDDRLPLKKTQRAITEATPPNAYILARNYKALVGLDRLVHSDIRAAQDDFSYSHLRDARELWEVLHARGITHLLYPHGQRRPSRWNNTVLFGELFHRHGVGAKRFGGVALAAMPAEAPPSSAPYLVLTLGLSAYPDGLYRVEQLDVDDKWVHLATPRPAPERPLRGATVEALLASEGVQAAAVLSGKVPQATRELLEKSFERVEDLDKHALYLKRR